MKSLNLFLVSFFLFCTKSFGAIVVLNGLSHIHQSYNERIITGVIKLQNEGKKAERFTVYQQDYILNCEIEPTFTDTIAHQRSLRKYLKTNVDEKILAPGEEYTLTYTITLPNDVQMQGCYWTVLMIEPGEPLTQAKKNEAISISSKVRYAIQIITNLGEFTSPPLTFKNIKIEKDSTKHILKVMLKNEGTFFTSPKLLLEVFDSNGKRLQLLEGITKKLYPAQCNVFDIEIIGLKVGSYEGVLVADNGKDLFGTNLTLKLE